MSKFAFAWCLHQFDYLLSIKFSTISHPQSVFFYRLLLHLKCLTAQLLYYNRVPAASQELVYQLCCQLSGISPFKTDLNWTTRSRFHYPDRKIKTSNKHPVLPLIKHKTFFFLSHIFIVIMVVNFQRRKTSFSFVICHPVWRRRHCTVPTEHKWLVKPLKYSNYFRDTTN